MDSKRRLPILILGFGLVLLVSYIFLHNRGGVVHFVKVMINSLFINNRNDHLNGILTVGILVILAGLSLNYLSG